MCIEHADWACLCVRVIWEYERRKYACFGIIIYVMQKGEQMDKYIFIANCVAMGSVHGRMVCLVSAPLSLSHKKKL